MSKTTEAVGRGPVWHRRRTGSSHALLARLPAMTTPLLTSTPPASGRMLNKVPEVTVYFWVIKVYDGG